MELIQTNEAFSLRGNGGEKVVSVQRVDGKVGAGFCTIEQSEGEHFCLTVDNSKKAFNCVDLLHIAAFLVNVVSMSNPDMIEELVEEADGESSVVSSVKAVRKVRKVQNKSRRRK